MASTVRPANKASASNAINLRANKLFRLYQDDFTISKITLRNIKSIDFVEMPIASLNVLLGTNSAGKSTVLQSISLLAQNGANYGRKDLALNGNLVKLGTFTEFKRRASKSDPEIQIELKGGTQELKWLLGKKLSVAESESDSPVLITAKFTLGESRLNRAASRIKSMRLSISIDNEVEDFTWIDHKLNDEANEDFRIVQISDQDYGIFEASQSPIDIYPSLVLRLQSYKQWLIANIKHNRLQNFERGHKSIGQSVSRHYDNTSFEERLQFMIQRHEGLLDRVTRSTGVEIKNSELIKFGRELAIFESSSSAHTQDWKAYSSEKKLEQLVDSLLVSSKLHNAEYLLPLSKGIEGFDYRPFLLAASKVADALKTKTKYLGPLRLDPTAQQHYEMEPSPTAPVGAKGEYSGYQLRYGRASSTPKTYPIPGGRSESINLKDAVEEWTHWFKLGKKLEVKDDGLKGLETKTDNEALYQKGTGLSQILPVLILCLVAEPGSLTLIEQPELHLHPAVQQRLGDFLLQIAKSGRHVLIETHSEYLVTRLRKLVYVDGEDSNNISIIFATKNQSKSSSSTKLEVSQISNLGDLSSWPDGFFDFVNMDESEILAKRFSSATE